MKKILTLFAVAGLLLGLASLGLSNQKNKTTEAIMQMKLKHAQQVLAGLAMEDFEQIDKNAQSLLLLSHESNWMVFQTEDYNRHSADFRATVSRIRKFAKEKNLDGATISYIQMTMDCVGCHKYVRAQKKG